MNNEDILKIIDERDLHCVLNKFCVENLDIHAKTIFHERSVKNKGKAEWLHPDMVGFQLTTSSWDSNIIEVCKDFYVSKAILYSFELKKNICLDTLREYYFQAVSNSSWSNEGYLVTASLDESNTELMNEIKRLVGAFGIGIIKLDILNPKNSTILFSAKRRDILDGETMNKLYSINPDYRDFIQVVINSLKINHIVNQYWDNVNVYNKLVEKIELNSDTKKDVNKPIKKEGISLSINKDNFITVDTSIKEQELNNIIEKEITFNEKNIKLEHSKPLVCKIKDKVYTPKNWYNLVVLIYSDLKNEKPKLYEEIIEDSGMFIRENTNNFYYDEILNMYAKPKNSISKFREIKLILQRCNISLDECFVKYEQKVK